MKIVLSVVLLVVAYGLLSGAVAGTYFLLVVRPNWPPGEDTKLPVYMVLMVGLGAITLWAATRLWSRWRSALGWIALVSGLGVINEAIKMNAVMSGPLIISNALGVVFGVGLLLWPKFFARKKLPKGG